MKFLLEEKRSRTRQAYAPYEEIDAKRTSKLGYFFLILMVFFWLSGKATISSHQSKKVTDHFTS